MSGTELANIINKSLKIKPIKVLDSPKHGNRHENMPTVNQALKGCKIQKKFTKIHSSCVFFCPSYTFALSDSVQHDIDKPFSATRSGLYLVSGREGKAPPPPKFWTGS